MSQLNSQPSLMSMVEPGIKSEQKEKLEAILKHVSKLTDLEKLYLYLKLPTGQIMDDQIKRNAVTPLSTPNRTTTTLKWLRSNYVEDKNVCVPKQEIYDQYRLYCETTNTNPVGSADFGKMVKTVFPNIHHRRLGQRRKSKYCYGGLKRKTQMDMPTLPVFQKQPLENPVAAPNPLQEMQNVSSQLVCEWACRLFDKKFTDMKSLAQYLIQTGASYGKKAALFSMMYDNCAIPTRQHDSKSSEPKFQDTQALLQRKLHQKEVLKEHMNLLKQQQKTQKEVSIIPVSAIDAIASSHGRNGGHQKCVGNFVSGHQHNSSTKLLSSNRSASASFSYGCEGRAQTFTNIDKKKTVTGQIISGNNESDIDRQQKYFQSFPIQIPPKPCDEAKQSESSYLYSSMSILSDSDVIKHSSQAHYEGDDHKHQKRMGDALTDSWHDRVSKRRRCMTSLGMPIQEFTEDLVTRRNTADPALEPRIRPISCPTLCDVLSLSSNTSYVNKSTSKETFYSMKRQTLNNWKDKGNQKSKEKHPRSFNDLDSTKKRSSVCSKSPSQGLDQNENSDKSSFHFVQKPTVIAIRKPGNLFPSVMSCPNFSSPKFEQNQKNISSDVKKTHNILNSLLSSDTILPPNPSMSCHTLLPSSPSLSMHQIDIIGDRVNENGQKLPHTLDNAYILSSQSNRSAFVPVASNKFQDLSRSRSSHPCLNVYSPSRCSSAERQKKEMKHPPHLDESRTCVKDILLLSPSQDVLRGTKLQKEHPAGTSHSTTSDSNSVQTYITHRFMTDTTASDHFTPITYSTSQSSVPVSSGINQSSITPTPMISSSPISLTKMSIHNITPTSNSAQNITKQPPIKTGTKSPVTSPRRQSRSRFTPIRPKINGCTPSPQKKDMRPVSMILKEQRVRNAQELLVNLANNYQGEVKLQMPAELLGLTPPGKSKSSDVLVTIGTPSVGQTRPAPGLPAVVSPDREIKVVMEPPLQGTSGVAPSISSLSVISANVNPQALNKSLPVVPTSERIPLSQIGASKNLTEAFQIDPAHNLPGSYTQDNKLIISDNNGTIYALDKDSRPLPLPQNVKNALHSDTRNMVGVHSSSMKASNVINIADINGQVIGPDDTGQTYLIVPSSQLTPQLNAKTTLISKSSMGSTGSTSRENSCLAPVSKETQGGTQIAPARIGISSSSALLSELSQLASKQEKTQTLIQHDSALSAFHKCAPNKQQTIANAKHTQGLNLDHREGIIVSTEIPVENRLKSAHGSLPQSVPTANFLKQSDSVNLQCHTVRKRKASKSRDGGMKDKKRQNTSEKDSNRIYSEDDDVVIVDVEKHASNPCEKPLEELFAKIVHQTENTTSTENSSNVQEKAEIDFEDTDALLQMINDSRSLTVKQTVMALNSLKAEMRRKLTDSSVVASGADIGLMTQPVVQLESVDSQPPIDRLKGANKGTSGKSVISSLESMIRVPNRSSGEGRVTSRSTLIDKQRSASKIARTNKRNMSLNLESLESDALLDNEPTLYHRLVGDVGEGKVRKPDKKTSVAVVAKTSQPSSSHSKQEVTQTAKKSHSPGATYSISADTLRSYQMILNERKVSNAEGSKLPKHSVTSHIPQLTSSQKSMSSTSNGDMFPRRSLSCVRDILERDAYTTVDLKKHTKLDRLERSCGAEYFDALLSKMQSKSKPGEAISTNNVTQSISQVGYDLDIPTDVLDFITESMSSQQSISSARSVSVPNTMPDFFHLIDSVKMTKSQRQSSSTTSDNASSVSSDCNILSLDRKQLDSFSDKEDEMLDTQSDEQARSDKQSVFLSPVGPAKLARRLSIEKSTPQAPIDRSMSKTPVEFPSFRHISESSPIRPSSGMKGQSIERQLSRTPIDRVSSTYAERKRVKVPFDTVMSIQVSERKNGNPIPISQSPVELMSSKAPVNRSLTQTPMDSFFNKMVSDSLLSKNQLESFNQQYFREQLSAGSDEYSSSQTPTSDPGYGSVRETPVSDFGYNSISPSPIMMSSSSFFVECGRRDITSPATIFMPLRSDSALSLSNTVNSEHLVCPPQTDLSDILPSVSNQLGEKSIDESDPNGKNVSSQLISSTILQNRPLSSLSINSFKANQSHLLVRPIKDSEQYRFRNPDEISTSSGIFKLVSHHSIPTPPFSPNSTSISTAPSTLSPLQFNIPFSPLPHHDNSPSPTSIPRFLLPCSTSATTTHSVNYHNSASPPRRSGPLDQQSPSISHVLSPSPHILARPSSSPHHFGTHPSPPFTPSSQRSLPSPCPTPSSFKSLISPRSLTPSTDSSHAPNGFMPIQSSWVQTASLAPTHSYIQPIKPVVTLASPSNHVAGRESQVHMSKSHSGILAPSVGTGTLHEDRRHSHSRYTPTVPVIPISVRENQYQSVGLNKSSSFYQSPLVSKSRVISSSSEDDAFSSQKSYVWSGKPMSVKNYGQLMTGFNSRLENQDMTLEDPSDTSSKSLSNSQTHSIFQINHNKGDASRFIQANKLQSTGTNRFHSPVTDHNSHTIYHQSTLPLSPSNTHIIRQTDSSFSAVPSKLQVDLTKLEVSQNPTRTIQSKPLRTGQCKINLDSYDTPSSLQIDSISQRCHSNVTSLSLTRPATMLFDAQKENCQNSYTRNENVTSLNTPVTNILWSERLPNPSCQDDLQTTLEVLRDMDSQYFPSDEDNSNSAS